MTPSIIVLIPALLVLIVAFSTKKLNLALIIGLGSAALIAADFSFIHALQLLGSRFYNKIIDPDNLYLYAFLTSLGIIITIFEYAGSAQAFARLLTTKIKNAKAAQTSASVLSMSFFIDDYLSCLTTGYVMRPITDRYAIARTKLAFLIHTLTGPVVIIAPLSTWIAFIMSQLDNAGVRSTIDQGTKIIADPFFLYLRSIPFIFYSFLIIASLWIIVRAGLSYGPMAQEERIAQETGNLFGGKEPISSPTAPTQSQKGAASDLIIPLGILIMSFIIGIAYTGNHCFLGGTKNFLQCLQTNPHIPLVLLLAGIFALLTAITINLAKGIIHYTQLARLAGDGFNLMRSSMIMVFLASTFGTMLGSDLLVGSYLAHILLGTIPLFLLPFAFYLVSVTIAMLTGSAWGTMTLMVPIAVHMLIAFLGVSAPITSDQVILIFPILGAVFSGAVCGNHVSPIAEITILASNSAGCYPLSHTKTQFWYALPAIIGTGIAFLASGMLVSLPLYINSIISLIIGGILCILILFLFNRYFRGTS